MQLSHERGDVSEVSAGPKCYPELPPGCSYFAATASAKTTTSVSIVRSRIL